MLHITRQNLKYALVRADTGGYSTLGVNQLIEAEHAIEFDLDKLWYFAKIYGNRDKKQQKNKKSWPLDNRKSIRLIAELSIKPKKKGKK